MSVKTFEELKAWRKVIDVTGSPVLADKVDELQKQILMVRHDFDVYKASSAQK